VQTRAPWLDEKQARGVIRVWLKLGILHRDGHEYHVMKRLG
jgi:hypothetical protein